MNMNRISCYALALSCLLASCKDEMKDEEMPTVSITAPQADTKVWLETTLAADVMDNQGVSKVEFYLDGELLGEDTEAPYELMLDTKQYEDGTHVLRTVAYDGANNQSEAERDIEILNALLTVEVEDGHFDESGSILTRRKWIMIADVKGNILQTEEITNGMTYTFDRPKEFADSIISATVFNFYKYLDYPEWIITDTYYGMNPDEWTFENGNLERTEVGKITGSFVTPNRNKNNIFLPGSNGSIYYDEVYNYEDSFKIEFSTTLFKEPTSLYVSVYPENKAPHYALLNSVQTGKHYDLISDDFTAMKLVKEVALPGVKRASLETYSDYIDGEKGFYQISISDINPNTNILPVYQPSEEFKNITYRFYAEMTGMTYHRNDREQLPDSYDIPESVDFSITSSDMNNFNASFNYPHDYSATLWHTSDYSLRWQVYADGGLEKQFSIPTIPEVITNEYSSFKGKTENLSYDRVSLITQNNVTSFKEYAAGLYKKSSGQSSYRSYEAVTIYNEDENARRATQDLPQHIQNELEKHEMHRIRK